MLYTFEGSPGRAMRFGERCKFEMPGADDVFVTPSGEPLCRCDRIAVFSPQGTSEYVLCATLPRSSTPAEISAYMAGLFACTPAACFVYTLGPEGEFLVQETTGDQREVPDGHTVFAFEERE